MEMRLHILLIRTVAILGAAAVGLVLLSAVKTKDAKPCSSIRIEYMNQPVSGFMPEKDVLATIRKFMDAEPIGIPLKEFDLSALERTLEMHPWIFDAQLFFDNTQTLHVQLSETIPVARVMDVAGNNFYFDELTSELPLSTWYRADLPVFTGVPANRDSSKEKNTVMRICRLAKAISADTFWLAQAAQIDVLPNGKMEMIPTIGNHVVELGYGTHPVQMLQRLKQFYKAMAAAGMLDSYKRINASFDKQIVAEKADYEVAKQDRRQAMHTYQQIVKENKSDVNANSVVNDSSAGRIVKEQPVLREKGKEKTESMEKNEDGTPAGQSPAKPGEKSPEKKTEHKDDKLPKAVMPKTENN